MSSMEIETLFLLDRNTVSLIKDAVVGTEMPNAKKQTDLVTLRALDVPQHSISPLLSTMEGERGYADSVGEMTECLAKESVQIPAKS